MKFTNYKLNDLGKIITGKTPPSKVQNAFTQVGIPFVTPSDMNGGRFVEKTNRNLSDEGLNVVRNNLIPENSVAVSCIGSDMGKAIIIKTTSVTNQQINSIIVNEKFNYLYIYYVLSTKQQELKNIASGSATPILNKTQFGNIEIKLPDRKYQDKVSNILDKFDNKIELNTQTNQTLEQIAQAIFKHWFIDFAPVHAKANALARGETIEQAELAAMACLSGKTVDKITALKAQDPTAYHQLQQTAAAFPSEFVETEMGQVPRGWERTTLTHICEMKNGYAFKSKEWTDEGIPVIKIGSVKPMLIELDNGSFVAAENETLRADFLASEGDILVGLTGYVGEVGRIPYQEKAMINQRVAKFMPKKITETMNYYCFIYCLARQKEFKAFTEMNAKGSAQANISTKEILSYPVIIATKEIHIAFENTVKNLLDKIIVNSGENSTLTKTRDELLPRLLSGEIEL